MNREKVIANMCYTWRHDYGINKPSGEGFANSISAGMTADEREYLWKSMAQIFDNCVAPYMEFKPETIQYATSRDICGNE